MAPSAITLLWFAALLIAAGLTATGVYKWQLVAALLVLLSYVLDCVDGEVARLCDRRSRSGSILEQVAHWTSGLFLVLAIAYGLFRTYNQPAILILGAVSLIGDATFHFVYVVLNAATASSGPSSWLARVTRFHFLVMPINTNLFVLGAVSGHLATTLWLYAVWMNVAWVAVLVLFLRAEVARERQVKELIRALEAASTPALEQPVSEAQETL